MGKKLLKLYKLIDCIFLNPINHQTLKMIMSNSEGDLRIWLTPRFPVAVISPIFFF